MSPRVLFAALALLFAPAALAQSGTLTTGTCTVPGPNGDRCTVSTSVASTGTTITCVWALQPTQLHSCGGSSWNASYEWVTTTPRTLELRAHQGYPSNDPNFGTNPDAVRVAAPLLDQEVVVAGSVNTPPTVSLTAPASGATYTAPATVAFTASATDNGSVTRVEYYNGSIKVAESGNAPTYSASWSNVAAGTYQVTAKAYDDQGLSASTAARTITVSAPSSASGNLTTNSPCSLPGPNASNRCTVTTTVVSSGTPISCVWALSPTQLHSCGSGNWTGAYEWVTTSPRTLELRAHQAYPSSDPNFNTNPDAVRVAAALLDQETVVAGSNTPPTVSLTAPANGATYTAPANVAFTASATDSDGIAKVEYYSGSTKVGESTAASTYPVTWSNVPAGTYQLTARAYDNLGLSAASTARTITVNAPSSASGNLSTNSPCQLPGPNASNRCTVTTAVTSSGTPVSCIWALAPTQLHSCGSATWTGTYEWVTTSPRTLELRAHQAFPSSDPAFATNPDAVRLAAPLLDQESVVVGTNPPPTISLVTPASGAVFSEPATVSLTASASDNRTVALVEYFSGSTKIAQSSTAPNFTATWRDVRFGTYSLTARATDDQGATTTTAARTITVNFNSPAAVSRGGSNVFVYDIDYAAHPNGREPFGVVPNYHRPEVRGIMLSHLAQMYAEGQRRLRVGVYFTRVGSSGYVVNSALKYDANGVAYYLDPLYRNNLSSFVRDIRDAGFEEILVAVFAIGESNPYDWNVTRPVPDASQRSALVQEHLGVVSEVRGAVRAVTQENRGPAYRIDIGNEGIPETSRPAAHLDFVRSLWAGYVARHGAADTVGFSVNLDSVSAVEARLARVRDVYGSTLPPVFSLHIYNSEYDTFVAAHQKLAAMGLSSVPWIIGETYYNDTTGGTLFRNAAIQTNRKVLYLLQWPRYRFDNGCSPMPPDPSNCTAEPPFTFLNYVGKGF